MGGLSELASWITLFAKTCRIPVSFRTVCKPWLYGGVAYTQRRLNKNGQRNSANKFGLSAKVNVKAKDLC